MQHLQLLLMKFIFDQKITEALIRNIFYFSMLFSDFAAASVLISFGVVLGKTTPLQLILLALIEIVLFTVNEIIGRKYLGVENDKNLQKNYI